MKKLLQNRWFTIITLVLVVVLSVVYIYQIVEEKRKILEDEKIQQKVEGLMTVGKQSFVERTRSEKIRFGNEESLRWEEKTKERERVEKEQMIDYIKNWIQGTWTWNGRLHVYGNQYVYVESVLLIDGDYIVSLSNGEALDQGTITNIDLDKQTIHYGRYSYLEFNNNCQKIYLGSRKEKECFRKVSNIASMPTNSSQGSSSQYQAGSNYTSLYGSRDGNSITSQLEKLDNEEAQIISVVDPIRRSGQFYPDILVKVMRMRQINDERIRLARQQGDQELIRYYELQKMRSEATIRRWGF